MKCHQHSGYIVAALYLNRQPAAWPAFLAYRLYPSCSQCTGPCRAASRPAAGLRGKEILVGWGSGVGSSASRDGCTPK